MSTEDTHLVQSAWGAYAQTSRGYLSHGILVFCYGGFCMTPTQWHTEACSNSVDCPGPGHVAVLMNLRNLRGVAQLFSTHPTVIVRQFPLPKPEQSHQASCDRLSARLWPPCAAYCYPAQVLGSPQGQQSLHSRCIIALVKHACVLLWAFTSSGCLGLN